MTTNNSDVAAASASTVLVGAIAAAGSSAWWAPLLGILGALLVPVLTRVINAFIVRYVPDAHALTPAEAEAIKDAVAIAIERNAERLRDVACVHPAPDGRARCAVDAPTDRRRFGEGGGLD